MALADFINRYEAALNEQDVATLADCYAMRFMHMTRRTTGWHHAWRRNDADLQRAALSALQLYQELGASAFRAVTLKHGQTQPAHSMCRVGWRVERTDGTELVKLEATYMVRFRDAEAKVVAFIDHDEHDRLAKRGLRPAPGATLLFGLPPQHRTAPAQPAAVSGRIGLDALVRDLLDKTG